jgi:hypothetical protein
MGTDSRSGLAANMGPAAELMGVRLWAATNRALALRLAVRLSVRQSGGDQNLEQIADVA